MNNNNYYKIEVSAPKSLREHWWEGFEVVTVKHARDKVTPERLMNSLNTIVFGSSPVDDLIMIPMRSPVVTQTLALGWSYG